MPSIASTIQIQMMYVAYYGRAGDPAGIEYWANRLDASGGDMNAIVSAFGYSEEYEARFAHMSDEAVVSNLYVQMFNRAPDAVGLQFYTGLLRSGEKSLASIALDIANGAVNQDWWTLHNKRVAADYFTELLGNNGIAYGQVSIDDVSWALAQVDSSQSSLDYVTNLFLSWSYDDFGDSPADSALAASHGWFNGVLESSGDEDWFALDLLAGAVYEIRVQGASTSWGTLADPYLTLQGPWGGLWTDDDGGAGYDAVLQVSPTENGRYYFAVSAADLGSGSYHVDVIETLYDDYSGDIYTPAEIVDGPVFGGVDYSGDVDWIAVYLQGGHEYQIDVSGLGGAYGLSDPYVSLYDSNGYWTGLSDDDSGWGFDASLSFVPQWSDWYYIEVSASDQGIGDYQVDVSEWVVIEEVPYLPYDDYSDDVWTSALIENGSAVGWIDFSGDHDWIAVYLEAWHSYEIDVYGIGSSFDELEDPYLVIYDGDGYWTGVSDDDSGWGYDASAYFTPTVSDWYYIDVSSADGDTGSYAVDVWLI